jgi:NAD-dependent deacetylase
MITADLIKFIKRYTKDTPAVVLTGSGVSAKSGIPTFRADEGLWSRYSAEIFASYEGLLSVFKEDYKMLVVFINDFYSNLLMALPNEGHLALTSMEKKGIVSSIITQNIDNLHEEAGSHHIIELHGNAYRIRCLKCSKRKKFSKVEISDFLNSLNKSINSRLGVLRVMSRFFHLCDCDGRHRIDIVMFGEHVPKKALDAAYEELMKTKLLFIVGTSGLVEPAAGLPEFAKRNGSKVIEINPVKTRLTEICDFHLAGDASEILPEILSSL